MRKRAAKAAENFRTIISVAHLETGWVFETNGNKVSVQLGEGLTDEINTYDHAKGRNAVQTEAQLRSVAAEYIRSQNSQEG